MKRIIAFFLCNQDPETLRLQVELMALNNVLEFEPGVQASV